MPAFIRRIHSISLWLITPIVASNISFLVPQTRFEVGSCGTLKHIVAAGTYDLQYVDIEIGNANGDPKGYCSSDGKLPVYFSAFDSTNGRELWVSDGTESGTHIVADINNGFESSNPVYLTYYKNMLYFQANDGISGKELWASDGTSAGTVLIADIRPGSGSGTPHS